MKKGTIILIPFPFTDLSGKKIRPALVLAQNETDSVVAFITTQLEWKEENDILLLPNKKNGLKKDSLIRLTKITTIDKSLALGEIGELSIENIEELNSKLKRILML